MSWQTVPLGELAVRRGGSVNPAKFPDETFELFSIPAYDDGAAEVCPGSAIGSSKKYVEENDVLISRIVPHIRRSWVVGPSKGYRQIASGEWIQFRSSDVFPEYLRHFLMTDPFHSQFMRTVSGVGGSLLRARPAEVYKIPVPIPPLEEQKHIARILDAADALRAKRRESLAQLDALLQSTFLDLFGDPGSPMGRWQRISLGEITSIAAPLVDPREKEYSELLHFGPDRIEKDTGRLLPALTAREDGLISKKFLCDEGDVLYSKIRPYLNKVALVENQCLCSADVYPVRANEKYVTKEYLWKLLRSEAFLDYVAGFSRRANIPKLNREQFSGYLAPVPPLELQNQFSSVVESTRGLRHKLESYLTEADSLFASLQQRAFSGEL